MIFWILVFILSIALLVKSADWLVESSEKIGLVLKISPFIIGVTIVAIGTSFPELAVNLSAVFRGTTEIVVANAVGSNIATIFLVVGLAAIAAKRLIVKRSLIDLDAPLLSVSTVLLLFMAWDGKIVFGEAIILLFGFLIYLLYTIFQRRGEYEETPEITEVLPSRVERREKVKLKEEKAPSVKLTFRDIFFLVIGIIGLVIGANYVIESVVNLSEILRISPVLISITALAVGTSLPELVVSIRAAAKKKYELALGNIFGSNVFTIFLIVGLPALFKPLVVDDITLKIGMPYLIVATLLFIISGISRRIHIWEGLMYLLIYVLFVAQLAGLF